jgi:Na+/H+-dicarboxylate symporter
MRNSASAPARQSPLVKPNLSTWTLAGLAAGIGCGLFFGELCTHLAIIGDVFVGLLQMTVMPYIVVSLIANLARLSLQQSRRLAVTGGIVLAGLWIVSLFTVFMLANTFPDWKSGSFFSTAATDAQRDVDLLSIFIPSNFFASLSENHVPAVVVMSICVALALSRLPNREVIIAPLDALAKVFVRVSGYVVSLAPVGVFAIAANVTGTISLAETGRMQAYIVAYTAGVLFLGVVVLPLLITTFTPFRYGDIVMVSKDAVITALVTGKLVVVLPMLVEQTEKLFERYEEVDESGVAPTVDVLYPLAYPFPHVGKLLSMLFIPFAAWFLGDRLAIHDYSTLLPAGLISYFARPLLAVPFLLDLMQLPHDMFQLFLLSGVYGERLGDALGAIHLVTFTLLATCAFLGRLRLRFWAVARYLVLVTLAGVCMIAGLRVALSHTLRYVETKEDVLAEIQLLERPVASVVQRRATPNPVRLNPGESLLDRIQRRGVIRVGYNEDKLPFAYFNSEGTLIGFDVDMAHALARDLGVTIEFVRFDRATLAEQLSLDNFDVVMSGLVGTLERAQAMEHTTPYMDVTLALVVPDYRVRRFRNLESLRQQQELRIGFVDLSRGFVERLQIAIPDAELVELSTSQEYFDEANRELDALLTSAESGSAFTLFYPEFEVVVPTGLEVSLPLFYAIGGQDAEMRGFLEHWVSLRRLDGTMQEYYDHWILGKTALVEQPRWSVIRDVLHWVD